MFDKITKKHSQFDAPIEKVLEQLADKSPMDSEYSDLLSHLERLQALRSEQLKSPVTDTMVLAGANLLSVLVMVGYERAHVMTSKSLGMLLRSKLS